MVKWIVVMKIQPSICLDDGGKPRKSPSEVGWHRDLNQGPPERESRALPRSHLARCERFISKPVIEDDCAYIIHLVNIMFFMFSENMDSVT